MAQAGSIAMPAAAVEPAYAAPAPVTDGPEVVLTLGAGLSVKPEYFGSGDYTTGPAISFRLNYLDLGPLNFGSLEPGESDGSLGLRGSFRYVGERTSDDYPELAGLQDVDATVELGLGVGYKSRTFDAYADLRYGIGGHESVVGELGADYKVHPSDRLTLTMGPRVLLGSDDYSATYFGVTAAEAAASDYSAYGAEGGLVSAGVELGARYELSDAWGLEGALTYDRFVGDAADSPIVEQGERDQYGLRIGLTRQITLDF